MHDFTVGECDRRADSELKAAASARTATAREMHLNRAAIFAHCSEEGRRNAGSGQPCDLDNLSCRIARPI